MLKIRPKVSIITPAYNAEKFILETIVSVQNQTYHDYEHIIIDDGSNDNTSNIIKKSAEGDNRIKYIRQDNLGPSAARNLGIRVASGQYISFIDSDDLYATDTIDKLFRKAENSKADVVYYNFVRFYDGKPNILEENRIELNPDKTYSKATIKKRLFTTFPLLTCNILIKTDLIRQNSIYFDNKYKRNEDVDFSMRVLLCARKYAYVDYLGYYYRVNNPGSQTSTSSKHPTELLKVLINLNKIVASEEPESIQSFQNYTIDQMIGSIDRQEFCSDAHKMVFRFASEKVIPELGLGGYDKNNFYKPELFDYFVAIKNNDYSEMLLLRVRALENRITELRDQMAINLNDIKVLTNDLDILKRQISDILSSNSWEITKPLRILSDLVKRDDKKIH